jgi:hypothetical protein
MCSNWLILLVVSTSVTSSWITKFRVIWIRNRWERGILLFWVKFWLRSLSFIFDKKPFFCIFEVTCHLHSLGTWYDVGGSVRSVSLWFGLNWLKAEWKIEVLLFYLATLPFWWIPKILIFRVDSIATLTVTIFWPFFWDNYIVFGITLIGKPITVIPRLIFMVVQLWCRSIRDIQILTLGRGFFIWSFVGENFQF